MTGHTVCVCDRTHSLCLWQDTVCVCDRTHSLCLWQDTQSVSMTGHTVCVCDRTHSLCLWQDTQSVSVTGHTVCACDRTHSLCLWQTQIVSCCQPATLLKTARPGLADRGQQHLSYNHSSADESKLICIKIYAYLWVWLPYTDANCPSFLCCLAAA